MHQLQLLAVCLTFLIILYAAIYMARQSLDSMPTPASNSSTTCRRRCYKTGSNGWDQLGCQSQSTWLLPKLKLCVDDNPQIDGTTALFTTILTVSSNNHQDLTWSVLINSTSLLSTNTLRQSKKYLATMKYPFVIYGMVMKLASKLVVGARTRTSYFSFHQLIQACTNCYGRRGPYFIFPVFTCRLYTPFSFLLQWLCHYCFPRPSQRSWRPDLDLQYDFPLWQTVPCLDTSLYGIAVFWTFHYSNLGTFLVHLNIVLSLRKAPIGLLRGLRNQGFLAVHTQV